eukprot:TRINITY_DN3410_c0_g1_i2.p1 TRINITY_DN3410_c0_g1~~TRINITY_DN3410_c0_g1_i2.p1  ORF type:complete len:150 (-),score=33.16 TRINITY_DN3410_c0_g1_i2:17-466(-)
MGQQKRKLTDFLGQNTGSTPKNSKKSHISTTTTTTTTTTPIKTTKGSPAYNRLYNRPKRSLAQNITKKDLDSLEDIVDAVHNVSKKRMIENPNQLPSQDLQNIVSEKIMLERKKLDPTLVNSAIEPFQAMTIAILLQELAGHLRHSLLK